MRRFRSSFILGAVALTLVGCGNDDSDKSETNDSGVEAPKNSGLAADKPLTGLSTQEVWALCAFERDTYKASLSSEYQYCFRVNVESASTCQRDLNGCLGTGDYEDELQDDWDCGNLALKDYLGPQRACTATVAQFEACDRARQKQLHDFYAKADCTKAETLIEPADPKECVELQRVCPSLIE